MARLRKSDTGDRRTEHAGFYVTPDELAELDARAAVAGYCRSDYFRIILLSDRKAPPPSARDPRAMRALIGQFGKLGNNWNQIAHRLNATGDAPSRTILAEAAAQLRAAVEKVLAL